MQILVLFWYTYIVIMGGSKKKGKRVADTFHLALVKQIKDAWRGNQRDYNFLLVVVSETNHGVVVSFELGLVNKMRGS